ncbi:energy transducer TonB [Parvularcula lutaonensis]|uniref:Energy transducer TonB n=1 Tax=Parvularcula lutaonensis TaxID=491923 RepID=A0ABV7M751_9PROT|nr:energy transducer TonB [Parvularcula lutaonensis]GGY41053.1 hypothetical protein GCM10007148_07040 [Parvularcula lutaonensis]
MTSFDDNLAQLFAYEEFLATFAYSYLGSNDGRKFLDRLGNGKPLIYVPANCPTIQYKPRDGRFPTSEFGYNGVVVYAYDLDDKGRTTNIRVLSEAPGKRFADAVERFVSTWRADVSNVREECRINQLQIHSFYTEAGI